MRLTAGSALLLSCLLLSSATSSGQAPRPPIKVGLLLPYTGVIAINGQETSKGVEFYFAKIGNKAGGREIQLIKEDDEAKPDVGLTKTRKLVERDRVDVLIGPVHSGVALAIRDYVHGQGIPLIVPVAFTRDLTAPSKASPWLFRVVETSDQGNFAMGTWVFKKTPYRKVVIMASDFVAGRHSVEAFMAAFRAAGGEIVKEVYAPLNTPDFAPYMAQVSGLAADAVYAWFAGTDSIRFVKAYREYGLSGKLPLLGYNTLTDDVLLPTLGDAALGIISMGHYSAALDTAENRAFVRDYEARYNAWPTRYVELGYVSGQLVGAAIEALRGEVGDRAAFRDAIRNAATKIQPPRGLIRFDRYQQVITDVYVMKVERQGNRLVNAIVDRIANPPGGELEVVEQVAKLPKDVHPDSLSRLPLLERGDLDEQGRKHYDAVVGPQSRTLVGLRGPSGIWLHSPRLAEFLRSANQHLRFETALDRRLTELAILVTARELDNQFEWTAHEPAALKEGLDPKIIDVVRHRKPVSRLGKTEGLIVSFGRELFRWKKVRSQTFARAVAALGHRGVLELAAMMGNYAMTAVILNTVDQQLHPGQKPLLPIP